MNTDIVSIESCEHPELNMQVGVHTERIFWCSACRKKIAIPIFTELTMEQSDLIGIVALAFGENWKQHMEKWTQ